MADLAVCKAVGVGLATLRAEVLEAGDH